MSTRRLGVYTGVGDAAGVQRNRDHQIYIDRAQVDAVEYLDPAWDSWNPVALANWQTWEAEQPGRRLILGLHLVPEGGTLTALNTGAYDAQWTTLTNQIISAGFGSSIIRLGYEPNNPNIGPWQGTSNPTAYKNAFIRIRNLMKALSSGFLFDLNFAVGPSGQATSFDSLWPGSSYVDIVGLNIYDVWWQHPSATAAQRWSNTLNQTMGLNAFKTFASGKGKPFSFPEWGLYKPGDNYAGGGDSTYFVDRMWEQIDLGARYHAYFDWNWTSLGSDLEMFPNARARYKVKFGG